MYNLINAYEHFLSSLLKLGRPFRTFTNHPGHGIFLRLDVDYDLNWASRMASINCHAGVKATFFVQISSPLYNTFSEDSLHALEAIRKSRQEVGLHFHNHGEKLDVKRLCKEFEALKGICPKAKRVVAWHNPDGDLEPLNIRAHNAGFESAYGDQFFGPEKYISDSNRSNTPDDIIKFASNSSAQCLQVVLHPLYWCSGADDMADILEKTFCAKIRQTAAAFDQNRLWSERYGRRIMDKFSPLVNSRSLS